jgi:hypothetical protein
VTQYYTYKAEVPLLPGQTLGYTPGKGYYAKGTPTPSQATKQTTGFNEAAVSPATAYAPPAPSTDARTARQTYESDEAAVSRATAYPEPAPATEARTARQTYEFDEAAVSVATAYPEPAPATEARTARRTYEFNEAAVSTVATPAKPTPATEARTARQTDEFDEATVSPAAVTAEPAPATASRTARQTYQYDESAVGLAANEMPTQPTTTGTSIDAADPTRALLGFVPPLFVPYGVSLAAKLPEEPDYSFRFSLGHAGSPTLYMDVLRNNFSSVFPISGATDSLREGKQINLNPDVLFGVEDILPYGRNFPVAVSRVTSTSFTFTALKGHPDGEGGTITFAFSEDRGGNNYLTVTAHRTNPLVITVPYVLLVNYVAKTHWGELASSLRGVSAELWLHQRR